MADSEHAKMNGIGQKYSKPWTAWLIWAVAAAAIGSGFPHGYNTGVINAPEKIICSWLAKLLDRPDIQTGPKDPVVTIVYSIAVSIMCVGGMIGGLASGIFISFFGPKKSLLYNNLILVAAVALEGLAKPMDSYIMLIAGRLVTGINAGVASGVCPMYLSVISPIRIRGTTASVYQLVVTVSILISQIISLDKILGTATLWPYLFWALLIIVIFQIITLTPCPESPTYLYEKKQEKVAETALMRLRNTDDVQLELDCIKSELEEAKNMDSVSLRDLFTSRMYRKPTYIVIVIMLAQQLSGINAIMYFSTNIFEFSQLNATQSQVATILMGLINVLMTVVSVVLVDMTGRKVLLLIGFAGMCTCSVLLSVAMAYAKVSIMVGYSCILLVLLFVIFFATGAGSIPWFLVSEMYYPNARPIATGISVCVNWTANFLVGLLFLPLKDLLMGYVFLIFAVLQFFFFLFIWKVVPETKDKSVEEIYAEFRRRDYEEQ